MGQEQPDSPPRDAPVFEPIASGELTDYLMQSLICTTLFYGYGGGLYGKLERYQLYYVVLGVWALQLLLSSIWLRYFRFGPMEWLWRSLTYLTWQPLRLRARAPVAAEALASPASP